MAGINKVILVGRLGRDPEMRSTGSGVPVTSLALATSESWTNREGKREEKTEWHNIVLWNKLAELANRYLSKGRQVYIEGKLQTRSWEDKTGNKRYTTEVVGSVLQFLDGGGAQRETSPYQNNTSSNQGYSSDFNNSAQPNSFDMNEAPNNNPFQSDDDIPF